MRLRHSLRFRVAFAFASFGALLSLLFSLAIYITEHQMGRELMDETLRAELEDSINRYERNTYFIPPNTVSIKGYVLSRRYLVDNIPLAIRSLYPGKYDVSMDGIDYRALVADRNGARYFLLFDADKQNQREARFVHILSAFVGFMTLISAAIGFWLALRVISPLTRLSVQVAQADPHDTTLALGKLAREDEIGELARTFDQYLRRIREFIERENYFTADVSHELRTPLAVIQGAAEILEQDDLLNEKQKARVARIKRGALDMVDLTEALLLIARERQMSSSIQACDAGRIATYCIDKHRHLIEGRPIELEADIQGNVLLDVERPLLEIVLGNLLRNAFNNTRAGRVSVQLNQHGFKVSDTGFGMSNEVLERVFERHFKGASSIGAGLGLSLVKRICERYDWPISIESVEGEGTAITVKFNSKGSH